MKVLRMVQMAIQPIDLQTLFSQVDKVGRTQMAQREGVAIQQAIHGAELQRKTEEQMQAVNETQNTGDDGAEKVKDRGPQAHQDDGKGKKKEDHKPGTPEDETLAHVFRDPRLGSFIDISL